MMRKMPHGQHEAGWGPGFPGKFTLLSFARICYTSNMSGKQVLQGAQNVSISGGTLINADSVGEAL